MLLLSGSPDLVRHLAMAVLEHCQTLRRNGLAVPVELGRLRDELHRVVSSDPRSSPVADRAPAVDGVTVSVVAAASRLGAGVADLGRRTARWRVSVRWYLIALLTVPVGATLISLVIYGPRALTAPSGGWPRALAEVAAVFVLQLVLFQLAEEIGFTGFLQHHWRDRYHPLKLTLYVALMWALWHMTDHFAVEGWGLEQLISAPVVFAIELVSLVDAR